jgi:hypothetical protein
MVHYFYLLQHSWFSRSLQPALAASWRERNFGSCRVLCQALSMRLPVPDGAVVRAVAAGAGFDRALWHALVDECLIFGAEAMPPIPGMIDELVCLLAPHRLGADAADRTQFSPIEQVYFGSRDLRFGGGWHRPERTGWNDLHDVARLTSCLQSIDTSQWTADALLPLADLPDAAERAEELAFVRDWWPELVGMYVNAQTAGQIVVCERA